MTYTYALIVNRFRDIVLDHKMLKDFGYGELSDIKVKPQTNDGTPGVNYPYAFLNPANHTRTANTLLFRFNLIVMQQAGNDTPEYLKAQSDCQQYIDDIVARFKYHYTDQMDIRTTYAMTPFKERFQDTVAGMTATLEVEVPQALNDCITPFGPFVPPTPEANLIVDTLSPPIGILYTPTTELRLPFPSPTLNDGNWMSNRYITEAGATYKIEYDIWLRYFDERQGLIDSMRVGVRPILGTPAFYLPSTETGWAPAPPTYPSDWFNVTGTIDNITGTVNGEMYLNFNNDPESTNFGALTFGQSLAQGPQSRLKIYKYE